MRITRLWAGERKLQLPLLFAVAAAELGAAVLVARIVHRLGGAADLILLSAAAVAVFALQVLQRWLCERVGLAYTAEVRLGLFRHLMSANPTIVRRRRHGAMLQSFVGDLTALRLWVSEGLIRGALALFAVTGLLAWLASVDRQLASLLGLVFVATLITQVALMPALNRTVRDVRRERGRVTALASERLAAQASVQRFARGRSEARRLDRRVRRLNAASLRRACVVGALRALPHVATTAMLASVVVVGSVANAAGIANGVVIVGILGFALRDLARAGELMVPGRVAEARIAALLAIPVAPRRKRSPILTGEDQKLVLDGLQARPDGPRLRLEAHAGSIVLLDGDDEQLQALLAVLAGTSTPHRGTWRWSGRDLLAVGAADRGKLIGVLIPDLPLVRGSAALNLGYRATTIDAAELEALAGAWNVDSKAWNSDPVRLQLLRAIAGSPPVLLLDLTATRLSGEDLRRLAATVAEWPGVVLLAAHHPELRGLATHRWCIAGPAATGKPAEPEASSRVVRVVAGRGS